MKKLGVIVVGTNNYLDLAIQCIKAAKKHINIPDMEVVPYLFTNQHQKVIDLPFDYKYCYIDHGPWPLITLLRYQNFIRYEQDLAQTDYLFYIDADLLIVDTIGPEILGNLVATIHPGFVNQRKEIWTYEHNPYSQAYINKATEKCNHYYVGSLQGGETNSYLQASLAMRNGINEDLKRNHIALWHDESHWNRYCIDHPPDVILDPSYCSPEKWPHIPAQFGSPKIVALDKDHNKIRNESALTDRKA